MSPFVRNVTRCMWIGGLVVALAGGLSIPPRRLSAQSTSPASAASADAGSLARFVPPDTLLFAEIRDWRGLEGELAQSDWGTAISSLLMGRADEPGSGNEAMMPLARALGINDPVVARRELFGRQAAIGLPGLSQLAQAVLLFVPAHVEPIRTALAARGIQPEVLGRVQQYRLDATHWLATDGQVVALGERGSGQTLYDRTVRLLAGSDGASLTADEYFREELAALGPGPHRATIYFYDPGQPATTRPGATTRPVSGPASRPASRPAEHTGISPQAASAPASLAATQATTQAARRVPQRWLPSSWPRLVRGVAVVRMDGPTILLSVRGQLDQPAPRLPDANASLLEELPATTLAAWCQPMHLVGQYRAVLSEGPSYLSLYLTFVDARMRASGSSIEDGFLSKLGRDTTIILGVVPVSEQSEKLGYALPVLGVAIAVQDAAGAAAAADLVGAAILDMLRFPAIVAKMKNPLRVETLAVDGATVRRIHLGEFFRVQTACPYTHTLQLAWTVTDRDLIVSTHVDHIRQILLARAGLAPRLGPKIAAAGKLDGATDADGLLLAQPREIAAMFADWLDYLARTRPEVLEADWWRSRQLDQAGRASLGFRMGGIAPGQIVVHSTLPGWPAHGRLQANDRIVGAGGVPLSAENPKASLRQLIASRQNSREVTLTVEREGKRLDVTIPLPEEPAAFDPIGAIRQIGALLEPFAAASYAVWSAPPDRFNARVMLRAARATSRPSLGTRPATRPSATSPASAPARATGPATGPAASARPALGPWSFG